jgi:hypothetical protein
MAAEAGNEKAAVIQQIISELQFPILNINPLGHEQVTSNYWSNICFLSGNEMKTMKIL